MTEPEALPEAARDRMLRRVDWRFLLVDPAPENASCLTGGTLSAAVALAFPPARSSDPVDEPLDLVVLSDPTPAVLAGAFDRLRPGGCCCVEFRRPALGGVGAMRRSVERAGFVDARCFATWPPVRGTRPRSWLPLDAPCAVREHWRREEAARPTWRSRTAWRLLRRTVPVVPWVGPTYVLARRPGADVGGASAYGPGSARPATLLLTGGHRSTSKVVLLAGGDDVPPDLVVKFPRVAEAASNLLHEAEVLRGLEADGVDGVPRLMFTRTRGGSEAVGLTVVDGPPLARRLKRETYAVDAWRAATWSAALAGAGRRRVGGERDHRASTIVDAFREGYAAVADPRHLTAVERAVAPLGSLPVVWEHRDFSPWNVHLNPGGGVAVLDWESAERFGLPLLDLVYFLTYLQFFLDRALDGGEVASYRTGLDPSTFTGGVRARCLASYASTVGVDPALFGPLSALAWMVHAGSEHRRAQADAGGDPSARQLREGLFFRLWEVEARRLVEGDTRGSPLDPTPAQPVDAVSRAADSSSVVRSQL